MVELFFDSRRQSPTSSIRPSLQLVPLGCPQKTFLTTPKASDSKTKFLGLTWPRNFLDLLIFICIQSSFRLFITSILFINIDVGVFMPCRNFAIPLFLVFFLPIALSSVSYGQNNRPADSAERPAVIQQDRTGTTYNFDDQEVTGQMERPNGTNVRVMRTASSDLGQCLQPVFYRMRRLRGQLERYPSRIYSSRNDLRNMYIGLNHCLLPCMSNTNLEYMVDHDPEFRAAIEGRGLVPQLEGSRESLEQSLENVGQPQAPNSQANTPRGLRLPEALLADLIRRSTPQERAQFLWQPDGAGHCSTPPPTVRPEPPTAPSNTSTPRPTRTPARRGGNSEITIIGIYINSGGHALAESGTGQTRPENNRSVLGIGAAGHSLFPNSNGSPFAEHRFSIDLNVEPYGTQRNQPEGASFRGVIDTHVLFNYGLNSGDERSGFYLLPSYSGRITLDTSTSDAGMRPNAITVGAEAGYRLMGEDYFLMVGAYGNAGFGAGAGARDTGMGTYTETGIRSRFYTRSSDSRTRGIVSATIARGNLSSSHSLSYFQVDALIDVRIGCGPDEHGLCAILLKPYFGYTTPLRDSPTGTEELEIGLGVGGSWR
jgi:hypothetical protein